MKKPIFGGAVLVLFLSLSAQGAGISTSKYGPVTNELKSGQTGVGLAVGSLSGLSAQFWIENDRAINVTFAAERGNTAVSISHLWLFRGAFANASREANYFVPYIGLGGIVAFGNQSDYFSRNDETVASAVQVPLGIEFLPSMQRFDVFAELAPSFEVTPLTGGFLTADLGARFYF